MTRRLRHRGQEKTGLILANGGVLTYQHAIILSSAGKKDGSRYPDTAPLPPLLDYAGAAPEVDEKAKGEAVVEVSLTSITSHHCLQILEYIKSCTFLPFALSQLQSRIKS